MISSHYSYQFEQNKGRIFTVIAHQLKIEDINIASFMMNILKKIVRDFSPFNLCSMTAHLSSVIQSIRQSPKSSAQGFSHLSSELGRHYILEAILWVMNRPLVISSSSMDDLARCYCRTLARTQQAGFSHKQRQLRCGHLT